MFQKAFPSAKLVVFVAQADIPAAVAAINFPFGDQDIICNCLFPQQSPLLSPRNKPKTRQESSMIHSASPSDFEKLGWTYVRVCVKMVMTTGRVDLQNVLFSIVIVTNGQSA